MINFLVNLYMDEKEIEPIVRDFYRRVMEDPNEFSEPFHRVSLEHHVEKQVDFLCSIINNDTSRYPGGDKKLYKMHNIFAKKFMNNEGSTKWMDHMMKSIGDNEELLAIINKEMDKYKPNFSRI